MPKLINFRIFGPAVGEADSYIDVEQQGIDGDGNIYFSEMQGGREFSMSVEDLRKLRKEHLLLAAAEVKSHGLWTMLEDLNGQRGNLTSPFAVNQTEAAQEALFKAVFEESR